MKSDVILAWNRAKQWRELTLASLLLLILMEIIACQILDLTHP